MLAAVGKLTFCGCVFAIDAMRSNFLGSLRRDACLYSGTRGWGEFRAAQVTQSVLPFSGEDLLNKLRPWRRPDGVDCAHAWNTHVRAGRGRPDSAPNLVRCQAHFSALGKENS